MPLAFSPLSEDLLDAPPKRLYPASGFLMRQIGEPPDLDGAMHRLAIDAFSGQGLSLIDATETLGSRDFLERILSLIRATGFTVAVFSEETRPSAMANISLELGFAAMCGKPLIIVKSRAARVPSDLTRTDWIEYDPERPEEAHRKLRLAVDSLREVTAWERVLLKQSLNAPRIDCAVAFERAAKGFLLSADAWFLEAAETLAKRLRAAATTDGISDLDRVRDEIEIFIEQARSALPMPPA